MTEASIIELPVASLPKLPPASKLPRGLGVLAAGNSG